MTERKPEHNSRYDVINPRILKLLKENVEANKEVNPHDYEYQRLLVDVLENGEVVKNDRTGVGRLRITGGEMKFDLRKGFPAITTKKVLLSTVAKELLWFLEGNTNIEKLNEQGVRIWDDWADENGELGPIYGFQWRYWPTKDGGYIDQITRMLDTLKNNPYSSRNIVEAWNVEYIGDMALPPCHKNWQIHSSSDASEFDITMDQRSADMFLGVPFNIASYALLAHMIGHVTGKKPRYFVHSLKDRHIYLNHISQVQTQLMRDSFPLTTSVDLNPGVSNLDAFTINDISFNGYQHHPFIKAPIAV